MILWHVCYAPRGPHCDRSCLRLRENSIGTLTYTLVQEYSTCQNVNDE